MADSDFEMEFLDEDAAIVQQCVLPNVELSETDLEPKLHRTLERRQLSSKSKRKRPKHEDDDDYDPAKDEYMARKRRRTPQLLKQFNAPQATSKQKVYTKIGSKEVKRRRKIIIPDYADPLCLPVKVLLKDLENVTKVRKWNKLCVEAYRNLEQSLFPETTYHNHAVSSERTVILRNVKNNITGKLEHTVWCKTQVANSLNQKYSTAFQSVLPKYADVKPLDYRMYESRNRTGNITRNTVILSKEHKAKMQTLVAYRPDEMTATKFKLFEKRTSSQDGDKDTSRYLEEQSSLKVCAQCFQYSWKETGSAPDKNEVSCAVCGRKFTNTYSMLTHIKTHDDYSLSEHQDLISASLSNFLGYHYKCRVCQKRCSSVMELRKHLVTHQGKSLFRCQIGDHITR